MGCCKFLRDGRLMSSGKFLRGGTLFNDGNCGYMYKSKRGGEEDQEDGCSDQRCLA